MKRQAFFLSIFLIIALGFIVYANSLGGEFIWDDIAFVKDNAFIKDWRNAARIFTRAAAKSLAPGGGGVRYNFYRPLQILTYIADYSIWGLNPFGYRFTNLILHILAALALFRLITILFDDLSLSFFTAGLFVVHPVHVEAVAFISGRADPLALLFILLSIIFYITSVQTRHCEEGLPRFAGQARRSNPKNRDCFGVDTKCQPLAMTFALSCYTLALLSRETSLILPLLLLVYHYSFKKKIWLLHYLPMAAVTVIYLLVRVAMARHLLASENITSFAGAIQRVPGFFVAITNYVRLLILPFGLHMEYGNKLFGMADTRAIIGAVIFALAIIYTVICHARLVFFAISWFFITLLPSSNIYPIGAYMAEHWLYLPSIGFFLLMAKSLTAITRRPEGTTRPSLRGSPDQSATDQVGTISRPSLRGAPQAIPRPSLRGSPEGATEAISMTSIFIILLAFYSCLTIRQTEYWKRLIPFYERTLRYSPNSPRLLNNLGVAYHNIKEYQKALEGYKRAIQFGPDYFETHCNLGSVYHDLGEYEKAEEAYKKELAINPNYAKAYNNLGALYNDTARYEKAIKVYNKALGLDPNRMETYFNLGLAYQKVGKYQAAQDAYKNAVELNPDFANSHNDLGVTYHKAGDYLNAIEAYKKAILLNPRNEEIYFNLAIANEALGKIEEAAVAYRKAVEVNPSHAKSHNNLAILYFRNKQYDLAVRHCDEALELKYPVDPRFLKGLEPHRQ